MKIYYDIIICSVVFSMILCQCLNGEIYNILSQQCLKCSSNCQQCFNTNEDNCIKCQTGTFNSIQNNIQCTQTCLQGYINTQNQQCVQCLVEGCIQCDASQNCLKCEVNLQLSQENNKCILKQNFCESNVEFIELSFTQNQCQKICPSFTYQNFETHQCEIVQVNSFLGNQYFIRGNQCQFALVNQNLEIINSNILQNLNNFEEIYMQYGVEVQQKSFIVGNYGGCLAFNSLVIVNFFTFQTVYSETGFQNDLNVNYIDNDNQIVFLTCTNCNQIIVFDGISSQVSKLLIDQSPSYILFQIQTKQYMTYYTRDTQLKIIQGQQHKMDKHKQNSNNQ
ncbi:zinc finger protein (macronuclear) [Tetrahymena thermophila SB210]|uniref:Zinc finger protein n=1 Tax=Tetrahymena thermophila (strain SB210) TaxID=312017 RepID=Q22EJ3_TETTS|nr:zinc finger protein [Tetrahymena thermophila SB210]EAR83659.1 zinc finger protein [Tetrahymena thermophila SB210]|eukprot:XP_001031322.1 zinc finger protein [Tetrahymena thermophila SB210]